MKRTFFFLLLLASFPSFATDKPLERPKLVVGVVVDQMRWDYLYKFYDHFGNAGFKRLLAQGFSCDNTQLHYIPAFTAPGHACIYTGSVPSVHGIAGNDWIDVLSGKRWYCTEDTAETNIGGSKAAGQMSPRNLLASTITDELRLATDLKARVFGFSLKDRGAILPAGHLANGAFWFDDSTGTFMSSSFYGNALPSWLNDFNNRKLPDAYLKKGWDLLRPAETYSTILPDNNPYESKFAGAANTSFPHVFKEPFFYKNLRSTPAGNSFTLDAAMACVEAEQMGKHAATDFLCISFSSTDYIGHQFSPNSREVEDCYLRLDEDIASLLAFLEKKVGKGNFLLFLTADHGAAMNPEFIKANKMNAGWETEASFFKPLNDFLKQELKHDSLLTAYTNYQLFLNQKYIAACGLAENTVKEKITSFLKSQPQVAYVADMDNLDKTPLPEAIKTRAINGYNRLRSGQMLVIDNPAWYDGYSGTGTTHGTWHPYDAHIPLLWYGWHIAPGASSSAVYMEDIAATLAALLHIPSPNGCVGKPIENIVH
jgi:predicted AlkP superfamily pyrophosphatase or phosphodiesterase